MKILTDVSCMKMDEPLQEVLALRDQFAMAALTGILSDPETKIGQPVAEYAYKMADLMLVERAKQ